MDAVPGCVFVVDTEYEDIAVHEARILNIPIVAMVDTNCDPDLVDYVIPSNDDATRAIHLIADIMANAVIEGRGIASEGRSVDSTPAPESEAGEAELAAAVEEKVEFEVPELSGE
jgi:small subunit ribosomal protein S2